MKTTNIWDRIEGLDSAKQELLFIKQKYRKFKFTKQELEKLGVDTELETVSLFNLFEVLGKDEKQFSSIISNHLLEGKTFESNGKEVNFEELKQRGQKSKQKSAMNEIKLDLDLILKDVFRFYELQAQIKSKEGENIDISGEQVALGDVAKYYSKQILSTLLNEKREKKSQGDYVYENESNLDTEFLEIFGLSEEDFKEPNKEIQDLAWKYDFFKLVQKSVDKGYVFTYRELQIIYDVVSDLKSGEVVLFTGDTGSGKTELARFLAKEFLAGDYVFVSGSKDKEETDFTIEKVVTSRSRLSTDTDVVDEDPKDEDNFVEQQADKVLEELIQTKDFKQIVLDKGKENGKSEQEIDQLKSELEEMNLSGKSLITEYHLMGIYKAAKLGFPCIIDEVNLIRPEVFMALNDVLTRKVDDNIQLPNALGEIQVKEGFCIILTGNDPDQNKKADRYGSGRNKFDEATYNRLRVYAKNYLNQVIQTHNENKLEELEKTFEYLYENELYGIILMMMFQQDDKLNSAGKYGFEVMKKDFEGNGLSKQDFFESIKHFSHAISMIQKAFAGEVLNLPGQYASLSLKDMIKRKVFSMRNLISVLKSYKKDSLPLDFHIYNEFVKHTTNEDEKYAILVVFNHFGLFGDLVTDNQNSSIKNVEKWCRKQVGDLNVSFGNGHNVIKTKKTITQSDVQNKFVVTKQDLYKQYFGSMELDDEYFESNQNKINELKEELYEGEEEINLGGSKIEINLEDIEESAKECINTLLKASDYLDISDFFTLQKLLENLKQGNISKDSFNFVSSLLTKIYNILDNIVKKHSISNDDVSMLREIIDNLEQTT